MTATTTETTQDALQEPQEGTEPTEEHAEPTEEPQDGEDDVFPRKVVEDLRKENARYRHRAADRDELAAALWAALVEATGKLADPTDLPLPQDVDPRDPDAVSTAVEDLLARKPHLAARRPVGDVGQGVGSATTGIDLAGLLRSRT